MIFIIAITIKDIIHIKFTHLKFISVTFTLFLSSGLFT